MADLLYVVIAVIAFALLWAFAWGCEALRGQ